MKTLTVTESFFKKKKKVPFSSCSVPGLSHWKPQFPDRTVFFSESVWKLNSPHWRGATLHTASAAADSLSLSHVLLISHSDGRRQLHHKTPTRYNTAWLGQQGDSIDGGGAEGTSANTHTHTHLSLCEEKDDTRNWTLREIEAAALSVEGFD